jgi:hypothetical protein
MRIRVDDTIDDFRRQFSHLSKEQIDKAAARAINRTLLKGRTEARKAVKVEYNIPQKNLDGIQNKKAFPSFLEGYITASAKPIPMDAFAPKFETGSGSITITRKGVQKTKDYKRAKKNPNKGVSIEVKKGQRQTVPYAFMIRGAKPRVFARGQYKGGGSSFGFIQRHKRQNNKGNDTPIKPLISITVHGAVINDKVKEKISGIVNADFRDNVEHEIKYLISRISGSG